MNEGLVARAFRYGWFPLVVCGSVGIAYSAIASGTRPEAIAGLVPLVLIPISLGLEFVFPETPRWRIDGREAFADVLHMFLSNSLPMALLQAVFFGSVVALSSATSGALGFGLWPRAWPLWAQAGLVVLVAEFLNYWIHRGYHESRLWPLHAVHHCSPRMYFLLSARKHPLQSLLTYGGRLLPLWFLGAPADALAIYTVLISSNSYLQHTNLRMTTGPLGWVLATPELHRRHHSRRIEEHNSNYGDSLILWDRLFGTYRAPRPARPLHVRLGLPAIEVPQTYWQHFVLPFAWRRIHAERGVDTRTTAAP